MATTSQNVVSAAPDPRGPTRVSLREKSLGHVRENKFKNGFPNDRFDRAPPWSPGLSCASPPAEETTFVPCRFALANRRAVLA